MTPRSEIDLTTFDAPLYDTTTPDDDYPSGTTELDPYEATDRRQDDMALNDDKDN